MAEAEDVITDAARHATIFARDLWRRHRPASQQRQTLVLADVAQRIDLLLTSIFGRGFTLRVAQPPAPTPWLSRVLFPMRVPPLRDAIPGTDGHGLWLPASFGLNEDATCSLQRFRTMALQQAMRAQRGSAHNLASCRDLLHRDLYTLLEARAADDALVRLLPGLEAPLLRLRGEALQRRPPVASFHATLQPLERLVRAVLSSGITQPLEPQVMGDQWSDCMVLPATASEVLAQAARLSEAFAATSAMATPRHTALVWRDWWMGELRVPSDRERAIGQPPDGDPHRDTTPPRSARMARRPDVRPRAEDEDDERPGAWMVQTAQPHEQAEDPVGLQRPTDRDASTAAEDFADALSELPEARLVSTPGRPKEVLISDDPPEPASRLAATLDVDAEGAAQLHYPEWDWRIQAYRVPGATVVLLPAVTGAQQWVDDTLAQRRGMLHDIRRRFELLRARRVRVQRQLDGDDIDLPAYIEARADFRAGLSLAQRVYQHERHSRRDMAITLLIDVSGSTDGWIATNRRVIDVEREALLLVCLALEGLGEPYSVLAFSGEGPHAVTVRSVKRFDERYDNAVAQRIAGLEPEHYTRAGAAIRHASAVLMREPAHHRLLLLLSDGKPNDIDDYEGRYGVEDMRQAVTEARLQGISPFCLTIDRQAANYLPAVFGPGQYALLTRPDLLPTVLLDWLRRLVGH